MTSVTDAFNPESPPTISTSFATRSISSNLSAGIDKATSAANGTISKVRTHLGDLKVDAGTALGNATGAIEALSAFKPGDITFAYTIPTYTATSPTLPGSFSGNTSGNLPSAPDTGSFSFNITSAMPDAISGQVPTLRPIQSFSSPSMNVGGKPGAPPTETITVPSSPDYVSPESPPDFQLVAPTLEDISLPDMPVVEIAQYILGSMPSLPAPIDFDRGPEASAYAIKFDQKAAARTFREAINECLVLFYPRLVERELWMSENIWSSRGQTLSDDVLEAQTTYVRDRSSLLNNRERLQQDVDRFVIARDAAWTEAKQNLSQFKDVLFKVNTMTYLKTELEKDEFYAGAFGELLKSSAALYNGLLVQFKLEAELYKVGIKAELANLEAWKARVSAEMSKAKVNQQLGRNYEIAVQAEGTKADVYEAKVQALMAKVSAYSARMQAFAAQADVAQAALRQYKGVVAGYSASLAGYKAEFQAFTASVRAVSSLNQVEEAKTKISMADMQAAGSEADSAAIKMQVESEQLKLQARQRGAEYENQALRNSIEAINAQIQANIGRQSSVVWSSNIQVKDAQNEAIAAENQAAARYFALASDSSFRASEQAFRAMSAAVESSKIAQNAAGQSAASVAVGAYSAVHVNANMQGSGHITAGETEHAGVTLAISDHLNYSKSHKPSAT
jgi:hypothetical protein